VPGHCLDSCRRPQVAFKNYGTRIAGRAFANGGGVLDCSRGGRQLSGWLDDAARGLSEGRYNRRQVLQRGGKVAAATVVGVSRLSPESAGASQPHAKKCGRYDVKCSSGERCCGGVCCHPAQCHNDVCHNGCHKGSQRCDGECCHITTETTCAPKQGCVTCKGRTDGQDLICETSPSYYECCAKCCGPEYGCCTNKNDICCDFPAMGDYQPGGCCYGPTDTCCVMNGVPGCCSKTDGTMRPMRRNVRPSAPV
jgi:hypothetical protein